MTTALFTDHYEFTMVWAALVEGRAEQPCTFSAFARDLPGQAPYGVVAGVDKALEAIEAFRFSADDIETLRAVVDDTTVDRLRDYRFGGTIEVVDDGELYFPDEPVFTVTAPFTDAIVLETVILAHLNGASGVATEAARMRTAAGARGLSEQGSRRIDPHAAVEAARAAWIAGFDSSSNLAARARYGVPTAGTAAHSWTLLHADDEQAAFEAQLRALGAGTTLLVDTFDITAGIDRAMAAARSVCDVPGPGAIRIDSGDLWGESRAARRQLDAGGATDTRIMASGEIDEPEIRRLSDAPVDAFGVGTNVVGAPSPGFVYKLVATDPGPGWNAVAKTSPGKEMTGGRRVVVRRDGRPETVDLPPGRAAETLVAPELRVVTRSAVTNGQPTRHLDPVRDTARARERHQVARIEHERRAGTSAQPTEGSTR